MPPRAISKETVTEINTPSLGEQQVLTEQRRRQTTMGGEVFSDLAFQKIGNMKRL